ncbi:hypothetical protein SAMN05216474_2610 [Lishizhenia tianjinensis]|uniref:Lipoprotein n=1 Tax=Lishizhenia tianjinensis TaxID=477690 RepID=A0A1I7BA09_9FLAO|nr:hypothetical protein [Lishizhenia tianjinensis]SFT84007.1 hypothetical protein SAMN05216474_2610 [Lishizhenia tianjinensis]
MQVQNKTNTYTQKLAHIFVLIFLLVLSSCSVRKTLQTVLDLPVTQVTSPNKTGFSSCAYTLTETEKQGQEKAEKGVYKPFLFFENDEVYIQRLDQFQLYRFNLFDYNHSLSLYRRINKVLDDRMC